MYCEKCGKPVRETAFYCQWCGNELDWDTEEWIIEKIKALRRTSPEIEAAKYMARLWNANSYKTHFASFEDFAWEKLGMEKSLAYKYKDVGLKYFDDQGNCLLPSAERWGIGKLIKLMPLSIEEITFWEEQGVIDPDMTLTQLGSFLRKLKDVREELSRQEES